MRKDKQGWRGWITRPLWKRRRTYEPWYDEHKDYNTNAKSYYDYLARFNHYIGVMTDFINRLMNRNILVKDTKSIDLTKKGDWIDNGECEPDNFDDEIILSADIILSKMSESLPLSSTGKNYKVPNGSVIKDDGLWSPDYKDAILALDEEVNKLSNGLQKIVDNLYKSGAITSDNLDDFEFKQGRDIATGNINLFGGESDGDSFIRTNSGKTENDISAGV